MDGAELAAALDALFTDDNAASVAGALTEYFSPDVGGVFSGPLFELLVDHDPYRFTAADLVALSALSEQVPARVAYWLLSPEGQAQTSWLLRQVPLDVDIWDDRADELLAAGGPLEALWDLLGRACWPAFTTANGMGPTRTSKLLAAKRPRLVPVRDAVVRAALPAADSWTAMRLALRDEERRARIEGLTAGAPMHVSLLRRIDAVVWYLNRHDAATASHPDASSDSTAEPTDDAR